MTLQIIELILCSNTK